MGVKCSMCRFPRLLIVKVSTLQQFGADVPILAFGRQFLALRSQLPQEINLSRCKKWSVPLNRAVYPPPRPNSPWRKSRMLSSSRCALSSGNSSSVCATAKSTISFRVIPARPASRTLLELRPQCHYLGRNQTTKYASTAGWLPVRRPCFLAITLRIFVSLDIGIWFSRDIYRGFLNAAC